MGRDEHGMAGGGVLDEPRGELQLALGIEAARRLVEHEQVRFGHRDGGDARAARARRSRGRAGDARRPAEPDASSSAPARPVSPRNCEGDLVEHRLA